MTEKINNNTQTFRQVDRQYNTFSLSAPIKGNLASLGSFQTGKSSKNSPCFFKGNLASLGSFQTGKSSKN
ncbi:MAG: hypothetical protein PHG96_08185, partial [Kiritimatiellae bacterium]|nr:hypothetical protein [Kiritimatiellia bacterium]